MKKRYSCLILTGLILIVSFILFRFYFHGDLTMVFSDIGSDTREQYLSQLMGLSRKISAGELSFYDFTNGFGTPILSYSMTDPFILLTVIAGAVAGASQIANLLVYFYVLRILAAGLCAYLFLSHYRFTEKSKILGAFLYAFNGYLMIWGQHYFFGTAVILMPLILWCIEKCFDKKAFLFLLTPLTALTFLYSYYFGYMSFLAAGLFALLRTIQKYQAKDWKKGLCELFMTGGAVILGIMMAAVTMLPSLTFVAQNSTRLLEDTSIINRIFEMLKFYPGSYYETLGNRFLSGNLNGIFMGYNGFNNYYEAPSIGITALFVLLLPQFLWNHYRKDRKKDKVLLSVALGIFLFVLCIQTGSMIFNGFQYPFARQTYICIPFLVWIASDTLTSLEKTKKGFQIPLLLSALAVSVVMFYRGSLNAPSAVFADNSKILGFCTVIMAVLVILWRRFPQKTGKQAAFLCLLACVVFYTIQDNQVTFGERWQLLKSDAVYQDDMFGADITSAFTYLKETDPGFYRVEKDFNAGSLCMDPMGQGYVGLSTYNSTYNKNVYEFVNKLWKNLKIQDQNHISFSNGVNDTFLSTLCNVKYVLSKNPEFAAPGYEKIKQFGKIYIYRNQYIKGAGQFFENTVTADEAEELPLLKQWELLSKAVIVDEKDDFVKDASSLISGESFRTYKKKKVLDRARMEKQQGVRVQKSAVLMEPYVREDDTLWFYFKDSIRSTDKEVCVLTFDVKAKGPDNIYIGGLSENEQVFTQGEQGQTQIRISLPKDAKGFYLRLQGQKKPIKITNLKVQVSEILQIGSEADIRLSLSKAQDEISGSIDTQASGIVLLSIPFDRGFELFVDGERQEIFRGDYGFAAFKTNGGRHEIQLHYVPQGLKTGIGISLLGCLIYGVWIVCYQKRRKLAEDSVKNMRLKE